MKKRLTIPILILILCSSTALAGRWGRRWVVDEPADSVKQEENKIIGYDDRGRPIYIFPGRRPKPEPNPIPAPNSNVIPSDYSAANALAAAKRAKELKELQDELNNLKNKPKPITPTPNNPTSPLLPIGGSGLAGILLALGYRGYKFWSNL